MPRYGMRRSAARRRRRNETVRTIEVGGWAGASAAAPTSARPELGRVRASIVPEELAGQIEAQAAESEAVQMVADVEFAAADEPAAIDWNRLDAAGRSRRLTPAHLEVLRQIAAPLLGRAHQPGSGWRDRTILFTSPEPDDGPAFAATALAMALAADHPVLLVDGDAGRARISAWCGVASRPGLSDALADPPAEPEQHLARTEIDRLTVLAAGAPRAELPMLLARPSTAALMRALPAGDPGRLVLIGGPPLARVEGRALALFAGQVVLVIRAGETPRAAIEAAIERLGQRANRYLLLHGAVRTEATGHA